ncbi:DUF7402 domain-containing protein [Paenibacillus montanisoli]|uniref:DUF7402 domain-containing protein n=1 Tax=Paenibacillus montanisoli TaxID=2081970 RepID=A0A328TT33_9BACL|nr:hypothetical protein DL346_26185 [Paenibacillus montanisoli]
MMNPIKSSLFAKVFIAVIVIQSTLIVIGGQLNIIRVDRFIQEREFEFARNEWASSEGLNPWIKLDWRKNSNAKTINTIVLYNRINSMDNANGGTLTFRDGSTKAVTGIPINGAHKVITFPAKT